jgi:cell division protein FtsW
MVERIRADYSIEQLTSLPEKSQEWYKARDAIKQPYTAKIAIHEGGILGKGSGNSTQKHVVTHIYSDYMYSFLVEEYGLIGGILVIILFVSLLARGSMIARLCNNEFAQIAVGGLTLMITGQAFMHILVNVGLCPMTGQTLPLISDGSFAFIMFCIAFGIILSISRIARNQIREAEEAAEPLFENKES